MTGQTMHPAWAIRTEGLSRDFGRKQALKDLNIKVSSGRVLALLGPNGAGKTTLLRLLLGLIEPTRGTMEVLGCATPMLVPDICRRIASMSDTLEPPAGVSIQSMIDLQQATSERFDRNYADYLIDRQDLSGTDRYGSLSKGQKRWVLATLVLASGADLLLLDEPAEGLDPAVRRKLYDSIRECVDDRNATAMVTTHVIGDIERVADDVALIANGRLKLFASLEDIREHVREVELPGTRCLPRFPHDVRVLGRRLAGDSLLAWVICDVTNGAELQAMAGGMARVRPCSLETVYLAATEYSLDHVDPQKAEAVS